MNMIRFSLIRLFLRVYSIPLFRKHGMKFKVPFKYKLVFPAVWRTVTLAGG